MQCQGCRVEIDQFFDYICPNKRMLEDWLIEHGAYPRTAYCNICCEEYSENIEDEDIFTCYTCNSSRPKSENTVFADIGLSPPRFCTVVMFWLVTNHPRQQLFKRLLGIPGSMYLEITRELRSILVSYFRESTERIGGPGRIVEIEKGRVPVLSYLRGNFVKEDWVFAGFEVDYGRTFFCSEQSSEKDTFLYVIEKFVLPGTLVCSEYLKNYDYRNDSDFKSLTRIQSIRFSHKLELRERTRAWKQVREAFSPNKVYYAGYVAEYLFRRKYKDIQERMHFFFEAVSNVFFEVTNFDDDNDEEEMIVTDNI